jgi:outer membrane lipoprotein-sorting protein
MNMPKLTPLAIVLFLLGCAASTTRADLAPSAGVDEILDVLDARGQNLTSFTADVKLIESDAATGDASTRSGKVTYQSGDPTRLRVRFDKKQVNNRITEDVIEYLLDGPDLIDRTYSSKTQVTRHVLKPGEKMNLLKLGEGPFPLPIGQKKEDVHAMFDVKKVDPSKEDPPDTVHLKLAPKPNTRFANRFATIDVWVGTKDSMPHRIETMDRNQSTVRTTELSNVSINPKLSDADFALSKVDPKEWQLIEEAYKE